MSAPIDGTYANSGNGMDTVDNRHTVLDTWSEAGAIARRTVLPESPFTNSTDAVAATAVAMLVQMDQAVLMVDRRGSVCFANESARRMLAQRADLQIQENRLICHAREDQHRLDSVIDDLPWGRDQDPDSNYVCRLGPKEDALLVVARLIDAGPDSAGRMGLLVVHRAVEPNTPHVPSLLRQAFGLTRAEAVVATMIAGGDTPAEIASHRNVSVETIRAQLRVLYAKTNTNRQAELVRLVHRVTYLT